MAANETAVIAAEIAGCIQAIHGAQQAAATAAEQAGWVTNQALAIGLTGVADALRNIRTEIQAIHGDLGRAAGAAQQAATAVDGVGAGTTLAEARGHLSSAAAGLAATRTQLVDIAQRLFTVGERVRSALRGAQPGPLLAMLDSVRQYLMAGVQRGDAVNERIAALDGGREQLGKPVGVVAAAPRRHPAAHRTNQPSAR